MFKLILALCITVTTTSVLSAQGSFDLFAVDVSGMGKKFAIRAGSTVQITDRNGYDNQPNFINDKQMAFSAADDKGNHDIIIYNFESGKFTNLTKTGDRNEFSPSLTDCKLYVSAVTVEENGKQRLWLYPTNFGEPELLYDDIEPVGYYDWYDNKAAMFVLGQPNSLVYPYSKDSILTISQGIGRTVRKKPGSSIITYLDKASGDGAQRYPIRGYDLAKQSRHDYGYTLPAKEDFIWLDKNHLLMAEGNDLYVRKHDQPEWQKVGSISANGYGQISRMAYSKDLNKLVVVMERQKP
jgi:hypothetical protein